MLTTDGKEIIYRPQDEKTYKWKYIKIDEGDGHPLTVDGVVVGGVLAKWHYDFTKLTCEVNGIEILPEYRRKGVARAVIEAFKEQGKMAPMVMTGGLDDTTCIPFWKSLGVTILEMPEAYKKVAREKWKDIDFFGYFIWTSNHEAVKDIIGDYQKIK